MGLRRQQVGDHSHIGIICSLELLEEVKSLTNNNIGNETNAIMVWTDS